ncbi:MAG: DUF4406 domain-containing protein [Butyricicoccus sp.]|nr:DUF4406 domain-containing protein [Butyricicoccus sp.]
MNKLVYIASPLSGDTGRNIVFARQACRYAIACGNTPFAPHLIYPQLLDDNDPSERRLGLDMGNRMLELCDELWLCGENISPGMEAECILAQELGIPVLKVSSQDILTVGFSPTKGVEMSMG